MNNINTIQNSQENIQKLAAQRLLYSKSKKIRLLKFILTVSFTVILNIFSILQHDKNLSDSLYIILGFVSMLIQFIPFDFIANKKQKLAASIQQEFDHTLYAFDKNIIKSITQFEIDKAIAKYYTIYKKAHNIEELKDWYPNIDVNLSSEVSFFRCQKTNSAWESDIRGKYNIFLIILGSIILLALFAVSFAFNYDFRKTIKYIFIPTISLIVFIVMSIYHNIKCLRLLKEDYKIISDIETILETHSNDAILVGKLINALQQDIYEYRQIVLFIPDFFYRWQKKDEEEIIENL